MKKFSIRDLAEIGVLAALVFVATLFLKIGPIPTPAGPTMLKTGNAVCLLGALLFGKTKGALSAGIGSMLYDLTDPLFIASAPFTFCFFFAMAFICGLISEKGSFNTKRNIFAASCGAFSYVLLNIGKSFVQLLLEGSGAAAALVTCGTKVIVSGINAVFAVTIAVIFAPICKKALDRAYRNT